MIVILRMIEYALKQPKMSLYVRLACYSTMRDNAGLGFVWGKYVIELFSPANA